MRNDCSAILSKPMIYSYRKKLYDSVMRAWSYFSQKQYSDIRWGKGCRSYPRPPKLHYHQKTLTYQTYHCILFTYSSNRQGIPTWCCICER